MVLCIEPVAVVAEVAVVITFSMLLEPEAKRPRVDIEIL